MGGFSAPSMRDFQNHIAASITPSRMSARREMPDVGGVPGG